MPLSISGENESVRVISVNGGRCLMKRLKDLGIYIGSHLLIIKNDTSGPLIIGINDSRIALGRGEASKIMVRPE